MPNYKIPFRFLLLILSFMFFFVSGCSKKENVNTVSDNQPRFGGTLLYGKHGPPVTLDPAKVAETESSILTDNIFETLVRLQPGNVDVVPGLAKSWIIAVDGLSYTFNLQSGVRFHDGTPFDAKAVLYSLDRQKKGARRSADQFSNWINFNMDELIREVRAVNDSTVQFKLHRADATFLKILSMQFLAIVSPTAVEKYGADFEKHPVGTGAFMMSASSDWNDLSLVANPNYWGERPYLDTIRFFSEPDPEKRITRLEQGEFHLIEPPPFDMLARVKRNEQIIQFKQPGANVSFLAMNMSKKPMSDIRVRKAVAYAINREKLVQAVYGSFGVPAKNPIPPGMLGYNDDLRPTPYNPAESERLLKEAGYKRNLKLKLWNVPLPREYMPHPEKAVEMIRSELEKVGIEIEVVTPPWETYIQDTYLGDYDLLIGGWIADIPDPDNFFYPLLSKTTVRQKGTGNSAFYDNDEMHRVLLKAKAATKTEERDQLYKNACQIFQRDVPWFTIAHTQIVIPRRREVMNFNPYASYTRNLKNVWVKS